MSPKITSSLDSVYSSASYRLTQVGGYLYLPSSGAPTDPGPEHQCFQWVTGSQNENVTFPLYMALHTWLKSKVFRITWGVLSLENTCPCCCPKYPSTYWVPSTHPQWAQGSPATAEAPALPKPVTKDIHQSQDSPLQICMPNTHRIYYFKEINHTLNLNYCTSLFFQIIFELCFLRQGGTYSLELRGPPASSSQVLGSMH